MSNATLLVSCPDRTGIVATLPVLLLAALVLSATSSALGDEEPGAEKTGWFDSAELSLVATRGNSSIETIGFKNQLERLFPHAGLRLRVEGVRAGSSADRFAVVDPGSLDPALPIEEQEPGFLLQQAPSSPDVEKYLVEARYDRRIRGDLFWQVGGGWDRNLEAGIRRRYQVFAGAGNAWIDREGLEFETSYGLSYTDREEETASDQFPGLRLDWRYRKAIGRGSELAHTWSVNANLEDLADLHSDMLTSFRVSVSERLALQVSLQWLLENRPALETVQALLLRDSFGRVVASCAGVPAGRCTQTTFGTATTRKRKLDTVLSTSLVVSF